MPNRQRNSAGRTARRLFLIFQGQALIGFNMDNSKFKNFAINSARKNLCSFGWRVNIIDCAMKATVANIERRDSPFGRIAKIKVMRGGNKLLGAACVHA